MPDNIAAALAAPSATEHTTKLSQMLNQALDIAHGTTDALAITLSVHAPADGNSITLDCSTGIRLSDIPNQSRIESVAATLLQLCASLDDSDLRIGLIGEYDVVHLYRMLPTADLDANELVEVAQSLLRRADGIQQLTAAQPKAGPPPPNNREVA